MSRLSQQEWVHAATGLLCEGGIEAVRIEPLAARLGVTKGSFYHHFKNRRELHLAVLAGWEELGTREIIAEVEAGSNEARSQIRALMNLVFAVNPIGDAVETSIRSWAAVDEDAQAATTRVDEARVNFVASLFRRAGLAPAAARRRALIVYRVVIGEFVWRSTGGPASTPRELEELVDVMLPPEPL